MLNQWLRSISEGHDLEFCKVYEDSFKIKFYYVYMFLSCIFKRFTRETDKKKKKKKHYPHLFKSNEITCPRVAADITCPRVAADL